MVCHYNNWVSFPCSAVTTIHLLSGFHCFIHFTGLKPHIFIFVLIHQNKRLALHFLLCIYPINCSIPAKQNILQFIQYILLQTLVSIQKALCLLTATSLKKKHLTLKVLRTIQGFLNTMCGYRRLSLAALACLPAD